MEVRTGYKISAVGTIPADWEVKKVKDIGSKFLNGGTPSTKKEDFWKGKIPWVTGADIINQSVSNIRRYISKEAVKHSTTNIVEKGNLLLVTRTGVGKLAIAPFDIAISQDITGVYPNKEINIEYIFRYFDYQSSNLKALNQGTSIAGITRETLLSTILALPSTYKEQTAIATALGDADALISSLEKLIAKKHNIKQGAMQQLLQPKEGWEVKRLGDVGKPYGGLSGKSKVDFENGNCPFIPFMNIMSNPVIDPTYLSYVSIKAGESQNSAMKGDLFFNGSSETPEEVGMCSVLMDDIPNLYLNSFCFGFRLKPELHNNGLFLSYFFRSSMGRKIFYSSAQGATRYNLSKSNFLKLEIHLPKPDEQNRIATIISDMDEEIFMLEAKLEKYKQIKQGMMQQLLTGKIRLV